MACLFYCCTILEPIQELEKEPLTNANIEITIDKIVDNMIESIEPSLGIKDDHIIKDDIEPAIHEIVNTTFEKCESEIISICDLSGMNSLYVDISNSLHHDYIDTK